MDALQWRLEKARDKKVEADKQLHELNTQQNFNTKRLKGEINKVLIHPVSLTRGHSDPKMAQFLLSKSLQDFGVHFECY